VEDPIPSFIKIKSKGIIRFEKPDGVSEKIYDRQRDQRDDDKVSK
jgi:hypothetical protein